MLLQTKNRNLSSETSHSLRGFRCPCPHRLSPDVGQKVSLGLGCGRVTRNNTRQWLRAGTGTEHETGTQNEDCFLSQWRPRRSTSSRHPWVWFSLSERYLIRKYLQLIIKDLFINNYKFSQTDGSFWVRCVLLITKNDTLPTSGITKKKGQDVEIKKTSHLRTHTTQRTPPTDREETRQNQTPCTCLSYVHRLTKVSSRVWPVTQKKKKHFLLKFFLTSTLYRLLSFNI